MQDELLALFNQLDDTPMEREEVHRAPFPYVGAKTRTLKQLLTHLPYDDVWIDAFGGSGVVTLHRRPSKLEVFNDRHAGITSFYRCLQVVETRDKLIERLELTVHSREEYNYCRDTWEHDHLNDLERAARWYYSVAYSFGGVGRNFGRTLDPVARLAGKIRERLLAFDNIHHRFKHIQVENADWRTMFKDYDSPRTVWYLDPPYYGLNTYKHEMTKADHIEMCGRIFDLKGFVALSGFDNPVYDQFPWDDKKSWPLIMTVTSRATKTDTSNVEHIGEKVKTDNLWIKEYS